MPKLIKACFLFLFAGVFSFSTLAQETITLPVEAYNPENMKQKDEAGNLVWGLLKLKSDILTDYSFTTDEDGNKVIKAVADKSVSGLIYEVDIDPKEYQTIEWRWKVDGVLAKGDLTEKDGDDYPARIYITFDYDKKNLSFGDRIKYAAVKTFTSYRIPLRSVNYIWANKAEQGTIADNPYTGWVKMIAVESGNQKAGMWLNESRNIYEDYKEAFGEEPPRIDAVTIMTDADNTKGQATAWYGDIIFKKSDSDLARTNASQK